MSKGPEACLGTWEIFSPLASILQRQGCVLRMSSYHWTATVTALSLMGDLLKVSRVSDMPFALELVPASLGSWALGTLLSGLR